jgi:hypothetical protein
MLRYTQRETSRDYDQGSYALPLRQSDDTASGHTRADQGTFSPGPASLMLTAITQTLGSDATTPEAP